MSSLIVSSDLHLMMLEVSVRNLFVPWISEFDKIILKKTTVNFRMLDNEWTSLSPNRHDRRPYRGSNCENENFYGGRSVVFCLPADFFEKKAYGINIEFYVEKEMCKYLEIDPYQSVGFTKVSVDDLLNSIAKQIRQRNELTDHLSNIYKRQIISRSMTGTYTLLDHDLRNTAATISLYIRISFFGKCLITEITHVESVRRMFYVRGKSYEGQPYLSQELTSEELQSGLWNGIDFLRFPRGRLICRCEKKLVGKKPADLARIREPIEIASTTTTETDDSKEDDVTIESDIIDAIAEPFAISVAEDVSPVIIKEALTDAVIDSVAIKKEEALAVYGTLDDRIGALAMKAGKSLADAVIDSVAIKKREAFADYDTLDDRIGAPMMKADEALADTLDDGISAIAATSVHEEAAIPLTMINHEIIDIDQGDIHTRILNGSVIEGVKMKGPAIRDNGRAAFKKAVPTSSKSKLGWNATTIGITERGKRISPRPSPSFPCLRTYPLCCQLQPHPTCFTGCLDISPCYYHWPPCPFQIFYTE